MVVILIFVLSGFNSYSLVPKESILSGQGVAIRSSVPFDWIKAISPGVPNVSLCGCRSDDDNFTSILVVVLRSLVNWNIQFNSIGTVLFATILTSGCVW